MRDKRRTFVKLAEARVNRTINSIRLIGNLSNKGNYQYRDDDIRRIFKALQKELDTAKTRFTESGDTEEDTFKLE